MRVSTLAPALIAAALLPATPTLAGNVAKCEVAIMQTVLDESGGVVSFGSYRPASDFLRGVYNPEVDVTLEEDGHPIQGIICARDDLMPDEEDYAILATGVPMVLSQDFDRPDSDTLTVFFTQDRFQYKFASQSEIDPAFETELTTRLADFSTRDHGLISNAEPSEETDDDVLDEAAVETTDDTEIVEEVATEPDIETPAETIDESEMVEAVPADVVEESLTADIPTTEASSDLSDAANTVDAASLDDETMESEAIDTISIIEETAAEPIATADLSQEIEEEPEISSVPDLIFDPETGTLVRPSN